MVLVNSRGLAAIQEKIDELNKRAARHGMNTLELRVVKELTFIPVYKAGFGHAEDLYGIEVDGGAPRMNGWKLLARVEFNGIIGNVVHIVPTVNDDGSFEQYRSVGSVCEHCNSKRYRKDIFVLEHENGQRKLIGRNCLADFLRCTSADDLERYAEIAGLLGDSIRECSGSDYDGGGRVVLGMSLERYLPVVAMMMRRFGWVSRTAAKENMELAATADHAFRYLFINFPGKSTWIEKNDLYACDEDIDLASRAIEWAKTIDDAGSEYRSTIKRIAIAGETDFKSLDGYAASIVSAYKRETEKNAERANQPKNKVWFGTVGKREKAVNVKCVGTHTYDGYYGVGTIVRFEHVVGDNVAVLVWFASGNKESDWTVGEEYTIAATVKDHKDDPKYGKQTMINRVA